MEAILTDRPVGLPIYVAKKNKNYYISLWGKRDWHSNRDRRTDVDDRHRRRKRDWEKSLWGKKKDRLTSKHRNKVKDLGIDTKTDWGIDKEADLELDTDLVIDT